MKPLKIKVVIVSFFFFFSFITYAQNLVVNSSFEDTVLCSQWNGSGNDLPSPPWITPTNGSPDYFSTSWAYFCTGIIAPNNPFGYQFARTGIAYFGLATFITTPNNNEREYIQSQLISPLINGRKYQVSFYVSLSENSDYAIDKIGAYLSQNAISSMSWLYLNKTPQIENSIGNIITDTASWILVSGFFIAQGNEQYITVGNFRNDTNTTIDTLSYGNLGGAYYYIDDVSVIDCTATGIAENNFIQFQLLENPTNNNLQWITDDKIYNCFIYDITSKLVLTKHFEQTQSTYTVNIADLKQGMYMVIVEDKNKRKGVRKFVKQ